MKSIDPLITQRCICGKVVLKTSFRGHINSNRHMVKLKEMFPADWKEKQDKIVSSCTKIQRTRKNIYDDNEIRKEYTYPEILNKLRPRVRVRYIEGHPDYLGSIELDKCFIVY